MALFPERVQIKKLLLWNQKINKKITYKLVKDAIQKKFRWVVSTWVDTATATCLAVCSINALSCLLVNNDKNASCTGLQLFLSLQSTYIQHIHCAVRSCESCLCTSCLTATRAYQKLLLKRYARCTKLCTAQ